MGRIGLAGWEQEEIREAEWMYSLNCAEMLGAGWNQKQIDAMYTLEYFLNVEFHENEKKKSHDSNVEFTDNLFVGKLKDIRENQVFSPTALRKRGISATFMKEAGYT